MRSSTAEINTLRLGLAASVLLVSQVAVAVDEVRVSPSQRQVTLRDNGIFTLRFDVENRSGATQEFQESIDLPSGWKTLSDNSSFLLSDNGRDVRLIHIVAPRGAKAGDYEIRYQLTALNNGSVNTQQAIKVRIEEQLGINVVPLTYPNNLLGGENYTVDFLVENTGNKTSTYNFSAVDDEGFVQSVKPKHLKIEPGKTGTVSISGRISNNIRRTESYKLGLRVKGAGKQVEESLSIPIIARTPMGLGKYQKLPGNISTRYVQNIKKSKDGTKKSGLFQAEYKAQGAVDKEGNHRVELTLRSGQNHGDTSSFNQQSEYQIRYENPSWEIKAGHQSFYATNLIGNSLVGFGLDAVYQPKNEKGHQPLKIRAFQGQSRMSDTKQRKAVAMLAEYQWQSYTFAGAIFKNEPKPTDVNDLSTDDLIASVMTKWRKEGMSASMEIANDGDASSFSAEASAQWEDVGINASLLHAEPGFKGGYADTTRAYANASYRINERTTLSANLKVTRENVEKDQSREQMHDREYSAKISRTFGDTDDIEVSLGYRQRKQLDLRENATTDRLIHATTLEYRQRFDTFDVIAALESGVRDDRINKSGSGLKKSGAVNWRPNDQLNLGANYSESDHLDTAGKQRNLGFNLSYEPTRRSRITGALARTDDTLQNTYSNSYDAYYEYEFKNHNRFGVRAKHIDSKANDGSQLDDSSIMFEFSRPLDIPLRRRKEIGTLQGRVNIAGSNNPAKDVIVQMEGQYAVTDDQGKFRYPDIVARDYQLQVDSSRSNAKNAILQTESGEGQVSVSKGKVTDIQLQLTEGARVNGRLVSFDNDTQSAVSGDGSGSLIEGDGISMVLLELHPVGDRENRIIHKRTTLFDGSFSFVGIPPGQWQLVVRDNSRLPSNRRLEQKRFLVNLEAGKEQDVLIRAVPTSTMIKKVGPSVGFDLAG